MGPMLLREGDVAGRIAAEHESQDPGEADPIVDSFEPLCAGAEAICRCLDPALGRVDALCARLGLLVGRLTGRLVALSAGRLARAFG